MRLKTILFIFGITTIFYSCCPFTKEESLGNNFYLSEYDNVDRRILYSEESCSNSGIEIVPMTVTEYAYDSNWIIAKSSAGENNYWIVDKNLKLNNSQDNENPINNIKSSIYGPFDWKKFVQLKSVKNIKLNLQKIQTN